MAKKTPTSPIVPEPVSFREFGDTTSARGAIFDGVVRELQQKFPVSNDRYTLKLDNVKYRAPKEFDFAEQKKAIMRGRTLGWNLTGAWSLIDNATGKVVDKSKQQLIMQVPYLTDRGTVIFNGNEYAINNQMRLRPGIYSRVKDNGQIEAHFNVKGGTGPSFRVFMEPDTSVFRVNVGQANLKLYPILRAIGMEDRDLVQAWGRDILHANVAAADPRAVQRAYAKLVRTHQTPVQEKAAQFKQPKSAVNYRMTGTLQQCYQCPNFIDPNACHKVQGFVAPTGWCILWGQTFGKWAQEEPEGNRHRVKFIGELVCDDSKPGKEWAYLKVHKGLPEAAYQALVDQGVECEPRFDKPHISVLRQHEVVSMKEKYGAKWKTACGNGRKFPFSLQNAMVDLDPEGWSEMDRVWFLEAKSPELRAYRKSLGLDELPKGDDSGKDFQFHITVAVKPAKQPRGTSKLSFVEPQIEKAANDQLQQMVLQAHALAKQGSVSFEIGGEEISSDAISKLAASVDLSEQPMDMMETQEQASNDIRGLPTVAPTLSGYDQEAKQRSEAQAANTDTKKKTIRTALDPRISKATQEALRTLLYRKGLAPVDDVKAACTAFGMEKQADEQDGVALREVFERMELDENTTEQTLGQRVKNVSPRTIVDVTKKLIAVNKGEAETDDRDSLAFQRFLGPEDLFAERVRRDDGGLARKMLWRATFKGNVQSITPGALSPQMRSVLLKSGLAAPLEEVNPLEIYDQLVRVSRMGEGGIKSDDSVPDEARSVQPSHFGFIDPIRAPESEKIGVDSRLTHRSFKGSDGNVYTMMRTASGRQKPVSAREMTRSVIAFPGEMESDRKRVRAMVRGKQIEYVDRKEVDFELPHPSQMFTITSNLVPLISAIKGGRLLMGAKMATQALPLQAAEAPLVQNAFDTGADKSFEQIYGNRLGAVRASSDGVVTDVSNNVITVKHADGAKKYPLYHNFPFNRKTYLHNTPAVKIGDRVKKNGLLAKSNYTDDQGNVALGKNLRVGYMAYKGYNADDAIVISESTARNLASEHMYTSKVTPADNQEVSRKAYISLFPGKYNKQQLSRIDDNGVVKPGTVLQHGDPVALMVDRRKPQGRGVLRGRKMLYKDVSETWDHEAPGVVTDVDRMKGGWKVLVKSFSPMQVGDKLSNRYGGKGVISTIVPDEQMPRTPDGQPLDLLLNPLGVVSRTNPAQLIETALGKVAKKTGQPYKLPGFLDESYVDYAKRELARAGLKDTEDLVDPETGRKIPGVFTGVTYMMKLHHMAEGKSAGRDVGAYTTEGIPAGGGDEGSKRLGFGELSALVSHGATNLIRDAKVVRGQRNDEYWRALRLGYTPASPKVPQVYEKFLSMLQASGINLKKKGDVLQLYAMTDDDVDKLSGGPITKAETVTGDKLDPVDGGLFDVGKTGGHGGTRWSHISLAEPMPNPVMEEPIRRILGLTKHQFSDVLAGRKPLGDGTGARAIMSALQQLNVDKEIDVAKSQIEEGPASKRDGAVKRLGFLEGLKKMGIAPAKLMMTRVPVLPPVFRPITAFNNTEISADANMLYLDLMDANDDYKSIKQELGGAHAGDERLRLYNAFKAVTGLGDPVGAKSIEKKTKGLLAQVFGGSPKFGMYQRRVLGAAVDTVGRGVITPNPSLNMDQVGMPESKAWTIYRPFVMRKLVRRGMSAMAAKENIEKKSDVARSTLIDEMSKRPVIITRAPVLHRYGVLAAWPVLTKGNTLQIPPIVTPGFNADFDGDAMNYHVPVSDDAVQEAVNKLMPSKNLFAVKDFDVHYTPKQEFLHGLYLASTQKKKGAVKTFRSKEDAIRAYKRGEIGLGDQVEVR